MSVAIDLHRLFSAAARLTRQIGRLEEKAARIKDPAARATAEADIRRLGAEAWRLLAQMEQRIPDAEAAGWLRES